METMRAANDIVFDILKSKFLFDPNVSKEDYVIHFKQRFRENPDEVFVLVTFSDDERVIGYIIATLHESKQYVWLDMIYGEDELPLDEKQRSLERLENWAENVMGVNEIRAETFHNFRRAQSYYGFKRYSTVIHKMIG